MHATPAHEPQPGPTRAAGFPTEPRAAAAELRHRFRAAGVRASKQLGQHFLADLNLARKMIDLLGEPAGGPVIEIGPGLGALTFPLIEAGFAGVGIERDPRLAMWLTEALHSWPEMRILHGDILELPFEVIGAALPETTMRPRVIGNLPYYATSPILFRLLEWRHRLGDVVLTMQTEVAERLCAHPHSRAYGSLTVALALRASVERCMGIPRTAFWPAPDVDSTVVRLEWKALGSAIDDAALERVIRAAFGQRRKHLANALAHGLDVDRALVLAALAEAGIDVKARAEDVAPELFAMLAARLVAHGASGRDG